MESTRPQRSALAAVALTAVAGFALTACDPAGDNQGNRSAPASYAPSAAANTGAMAGVIDKYEEDAPGATFFASLLSGDNEVPVQGKPPVGDRDGAAVALMRIQGDDVSFAFAWTGIGTPTMGHIHQGARGVNGDVKIPFFMTKLADGKNYVFGTTKVTDDALLQDIKAHPENFYFNLHTDEFPGGAVRGQVFPLPTKVSLPDTIRNSTARHVVKGAQVYACTRQPDGGYAFTQDNVDATLEGGIRHTFAKPGPAGPPQWVAPDGSAVTGTAINKLDNGEGNIPELILSAERTGSPQGVLAKTKAVLRLDTVGGVAPAGTCNPSSQPRISVGYSADYLFLGR